MNKIILNSRKKIINQIINAFNICSVVVLVGSEGSGKTTIGRYITENNLIPNIKEIVWINCLNGDLKNYNRMKYKESVLYIIDDYERQYMGEKLLDDLAKSNKILIMTRKCDLKISHYNIVLDKLTINEAKELLSLYNPNLSNKMMEKVINIADYNPAMIELIGKISSNDVKTFVDILSKVKDDYSLANGNKIVILSLYMNLAKEYMREKEYIQAEIWFKRALHFSNTYKISKYYGEIYLALAIICEKLKCYSKAIDWLKLAEPVVDNENIIIIIINEFAGILSKQGHPDEAEKYLLSYIDKYKNKPHIKAMIYNNMAGILVDHKRYQEAKVYLNKSNNILESVVGNESKEFEIVKENLVKVQEKLEKMN